MIKVLPFKKEHFELMDIRDYENQTLCHLPQLRAGLQLWEHDNNTYTIFCDGRIIAIIGYVELWEGVCEIFLIPSIYLKKYALSFMKVLKNLKDTPVLDKFHRVQIRGLDDELHNRFNSFFGFVEEGTLRKYDQKGNDFKIWARVK